MLREHKQVTVLRKDLNMRKCKMVAQGAHASMAAIWRLSHRDGNRPAIPLDERVETWLCGRFTQFCVSVNSEAELLAVHEKARAAGVLTSLILDAGLTEFGGVPTHTAVAIGPDYSTKFDQITGELPLL